MQALDRAKRLTAALCKIAERRDRLVEKANADFRLDLISAIDPVDAETIALVQRGLAMDRVQESLQYALQMTLDERNEQRRKGDPASTRRSSELRPPPLPREFGDPHEAETDAPPAPLSLDDLGDEDDLSGLDTPLPPMRAYPPGATALLISSPEQARELYGAGTDAGEAAAAILRYPEPGEPAVTLPDGTVVAAEAVGASA